MWQLAYQSITVILTKCVHWLVYTVIFSTWQRFNDTSQSKLQAEYRDCLLPFGLSVCYSKHQYWQIQNYGFASPFVWVWNLLCHSKGRNGLRVLDRGVLRKVYGLQKEQVTGDWRGLRDCIVRSVIVCTVRVIRQMDGACGTNGGEEWCIYGSGWETWRKDTVLKI